MVTAAVVAASLAGVILSGAAAVAASADELAAVRNATARFHDVDKAEGD